MNLSSLYFPNMIFQMCYRQYLMAFYLPVSLAKIFQALRMSLLSNIGFINYKVFASSLFGQQHTWVVTSQL